MRALRSSLCLFVVAAVLGSLSPCTAQLMNSPWPAFRHDAAHTGRCGIEGPSAGVVTWSYELGGDGASSPAVGNGVLYAVGAAGLVCVTTAGERVWTYEFAGGGRSSPAIGSDGTVYVGTMDGRLYAIRQDGTLKYRKFLSGAASSSPTVSPDGSVYIGTSAGRLEAYKTDGSYKFSYVAGGAITSSAAVAPDGTVYFGCDDGSLYALWPTGTLKWKFSTSPAGAVASSPSVGTDGTICFGTMNGFLYSVWPSGSQRWRIMAGGPVASSPSVSSDGSVCFGCRDGFVYCVSNVGGLRWKLQTGGFVDSSPAVDSNGVIYVGSGGGSVYAINADGTLRWSAEVSGGVISSPAIGPDRTLYVAGYDGTLRRICSDATPPPAPVVTDDGAYTTNSSALHATWTCSDPESGIAHYEYAIGTAPGEQDVVAFTDVGPVSEVTRTGLALTNGGRYYFAVRAINGAGLVSEAGVSDGIKVDTTPPAVPVVVDDGEYTGSASVLHFVYSSGDTESGIEHYEYSVGTSQGATDVLGWQDAALIREQTLTGLTLANGTTYYANVRAYNYAGLVSNGSSNGIRVDLTPPVVTQVSVTASPTEMRVNIAASDPESGISQIQYILTNSPQPPASPDWQTVTAGQEVVIPGPFSPGQTYYVAARAANGLQVWSEVRVSDPVMLDSTPPTTPVVTDDGVYTSDPTTLHASWQSHDPDSGILRYAYCVGTAPGGTDIRGWTNIDATSATVSGLSLADGVTCYFSVKSTNRAGLQSAVGISDGITVDSSPPATPTVVDDGEYTSIQDSLHALLQSSDGQSGIAGYSFCVGTTPGSDNVFPWTSCGSGGVATAPGLALEEGIAYYFSAKARNGAGLWSGVGSSDGIVYRLGNSVWPKFRGDTRNTGRSSIRGSALGQLYWRVQTGGYVESSPAIGDDGTTYVGSSDGKMYAISPTGTVRWTYQTAGPIDSSPTVGPQGEIYFGSYDRYLYCLRPNGQLLWRYYAGGMIWSSPALAHDGTAYFGCQDGKLYAVDNTGTLKWSYNAGAAIWSSPAIGDDGSVYFGCGNGKVCAVSPAGSLRWSYATGSAVDASPCVGADGAIYVGSGDGNFYALNPNGGLKWKRQVGNLVDSSAAIGLDGSIYVGTGGAGFSGEIYSFTPNGDVRWHLPLDHGVRSSPAVDSDGRVYFGCGAGKAHCRASDGSQVWSYNVGQSILSSPALGPNGAVIVGADDGCVYCFRDYGGGDSTPPTAPVVHAADTRLVHGEALCCEWEALDPESGIESYSYAIGTQPGADDVVAWTNAGHLKSITRSDLPLVVGQSYYVSVKARNYAWLVSAVGTSEAIRCVKAVSDSIGVAKRQPLGSVVHLTEKVVVGVFSDCVFVEEPDRSAGIRCMLQTSGLQSGQVVNVDATTSSLNGEPVLVGVTLEPVGVSSSIAALYMPLRNMFSAGLDPKGILVRVVGRVTRTGSDYFVLSDGSYLFSPRQAMGVEVRVSPAKVPALNARLAVTGVACVEPVYAIPVIVIRAVSDPRPAP